MDISGAIPPSSLLSTAFGAARGPASGPSWISSAELLGQPASTTTPAVPQTAGPDRQAPLSDQQTPLSDQQALLVAAAMMSSGNGSGIPAMLAKFLSETAAGPAEGGVGTLEAGLSAILEAAASGSHASLPTLQARFSA